jgi:hypothetical protein
MYLHAWYARRQSVNRRDQIAKKKKGELFDRIYYNTSQRATKRVMFRVRSLRSFSSCRLVGSGNAPRR